MKVQIKVVIPRYYYADTTPGKEGINLVDGSAYGCEANFPPGVVSAEEIAACMTLALDKLMHEKRYDPRNWARVVCGEGQFLHDGNRPSTPQVTPIEDREAGVCG